MKYPKLVMIVANVLLWVPVLFLVFALWTWAEAHEPPDTTCKIELDKHSSISAQIVEIDDKPTAVLVIDVNETGSMSYCVIDAVNGEFIRIHSKAPFENWGNWTIRTAPEQSKASDTGCIYENATHCMNKAGRTWQKNPEQ